jgi:hypothetical protein
VAKLLYCLAGGFGVVLVIVAWTIDPSTTAKNGATPVGVLLVALAAMAVLTRTAPWLPRLGAALSVVAVIFGFAAIQAHGPTRITAIVVGALDCALFLLAQALPQPGPVFAVDKDGRPMAEIRSLAIKGNNLAAKSVLLGSMPSTVYLTPLELWKLFGLFTPVVLRSLPRLILLGWRANRTVQRDSFR